MNPRFLTRRDFLAGTTTLLAAGGSLPAFLARTARAATPARRDGRILVVVQLTGGNDGLNTVIPYRDDLYHRARPTLALSAANVHKLNDDLALHPDMTAFKRLFDDGRLAVVEGVGYPNPQRSHFESMDIWHSADLEARQARTGWLGRAVDHADAARAVGPEGAAPLAINLDDGPLPLALISERGSTPSIRDINAFRLDGPLAQAGDSLRSAIAAPRASAAADLLFVQRTALSSCENAARLERVAASGDGSGNYPAHRLAGKLRQIAQLIAADFGARIYYTSLGGFDTHAKQVLAHGPLLRELAESVAAFYDDLQARGLADRVLLMTFSEFGRRLAENGSQGTDHGSAAPLFVAGPACRSGVIGAKPDLADLDDGDVKFQIDFRRVYATLLSHWLSIDPQPVLGAAFEPLALL